MGNGEGAPGNRVDVNSKGEKQRQRGTEGSHVRHPEAASAQGIWVTLHNKRCQWEQCNLALGGTDEVARLYSPFFSHFLSRPGKAQPWDGVY